MKTLKEYTNKEIKELLALHNELVKDEYQTDINGMIYLLTTANTDNDLTLPYFELSSNETLSGNAVVFDLHWAEE